MASADSNVLEELDEERARLFQERISFIKYYVAWIKRVSNEQWSTQQARLINAVLLNASNMSMSKEQYLALIYNKQMK